MLRRWMAVLLTLCLFPGAFAFAGAGYDIRLSQAAREVIAADGGYESEEAFLQAVEKNIAGISRLLDRPDWPALYQGPDGAPFAIEYRPVETASHVEGGYEAYKRPTPVVYLNRALFEGGLAPITHETTHLLVPFYSLHSLREGLAGYCQEQVGTNPSVFSFQAPVHAHVRYLLAYVPEHVRAVVDVLGNMEAEIACALSPLRVTYYVVAHSLCKYIIETYGMEAFMALYDADPALLSFKAALGASLQDILADWLHMIEGMALPTHEEMRAYGVLIVYDE